MLQVTVETVAGKDHQFFFEGDLQDLNTVLSKGGVPCCDSMGNTTTKVKSFNVSNVSVMTTVEVEPTPEPVF